MPRKRYVDRPVKWTVYVPASVAEALRTILDDPVYDKPYYGARGKIIEQLLREAIADVQDGSRHFNHFTQKLTKREGAATLPERELEVIEDPRDLLRDL